MGDFLKQVLDELRSPETRPTWLWWFAITLSAIFNMHQLTKVLCSPVNRPGNQSPRERAYEKWMKTVAIFYVIACSVRSFFPVMYGSHGCFFSFQSPVVNRALAFIAEVSLPIGVSAAFKFFSSSLKEWRFSLPKSDRVLVESLRMATRTNEMKLSVGFIFYFSEIFLDFSIWLILFANICCNLGLFSKNNWWFIIEESCWTIYLLGTSFIIIFLAFHLWIAIPPAEENKLSSLARKDLKNLKRVFLLSLIVCIGGFLIIVLSDLQKLWVLAKKDCEEIFCDHMLDLNLTVGLEGARTCSVLDRKWKLWKFAASWQTPYFTLSVWAVILFASCPGTEIFRTKVIH